MSYSVACKDIGVDCDWKGSSETKGELMALAANHAKEVHEYTDEQVNDPEFVGQIESVLVAD
jgi:predicted small metal-binding protein